MISLTIQGRVPSKKNAWRRKEGQRAYLPAQIAADIEALEWEAISARNKIPFSDLAKIHAAKRLRVIGEFHVKKEVVDLDNAWTTLLDVLQKAGIIINDKTVRSAAYEEILDPDQPEYVRIEVMPWI
jgi:Holliday junction resolvase RusA-like endonuclease